MSAEILLTCPWCRTPNFTQRGLRAHFCQPGGKGPKRQLSAPALHAARKSAGLVCVAAPSPSPMSSALVTKTKSKAPQTIDVEVAFVDSKLTADTRLTKFQAATIDLIEDAARFEKLNIERRIGIGIALRIVKASIPHGQFTSWLKANVKDAGYTQCTYMMRLADVFVKDTGLGRDTLKAIGAGKVSLKLKEKGKPTAIQKAATDFVGDLTWIELLDKHDIRSGSDKGAGGGPNPKPKPLSAEELYQQARDEIGMMIESGERLLLKENRLQHLAGHPEEIAGIVTGLRDLADKVAEASAPLIKPAKK